MNIILQKQKQRLKWVQTYHQLGSVSKAALRCGVARSTLYRWIKRYENGDLTEMSDKSHRPHHLAHQKVDKKVEKLILETREQRRWGPLRISTFLRRVHKIRLSSMTIYRYLKKHEVKPIKKIRSKKSFIRYNRPVPGDRVQIDVTKIAPKAYQFTAIDDCTRLRVLRIYPNKTAKSSIHFLGEMLDNFPFPIQRIQSDWGTEFFNYSFQEELHEHFIKFRPIKPRSPHLNGKVERSQQTDKVEFWSLFDLKNTKLELSKMVLEWESFYNKKRPHSSLEGKTPWQKFQQVEHLVPIQPEVTQAFWDAQEEVKARDSYYFYKYSKK